MSVASDLERLMLDMVNAERAAQGLGALTLEFNLNAAAEDHSAWILAEDVFSHYGENDSTWTDRARAAGFDIKAPWGVGENLALEPIRGSADLTDDVARLHAALMNSPGHRANLLDGDWTHVGMGIVTGHYSGIGSSIVVTQLFGRTAGTVDEDLLEPAVPGVSIVGDVGGAAHDTLTGSVGDDTIEGGAGRDVLHGYGGRDSIVGGYGDDVIYGGDGSDWLYGNTSLDTLYGGAGNDYISAGDGVDLVWGGDGHDEILGRSGTDTLYGQNGMDVIQGNYGADLIYGGAESDTLYGGSAWDTMYGGTSGDTLYGMMGSDTLYGDSGDDLVVGGSGDDTLSGNGGNDTLWGNQGVDWLHGGSGDDILRGGTLADTFVFTDGGNRDRIEDFERGTDTLSLDTDLWSGTLTAAQVVKTYAVVMSQGVLFDFGSDEILLEGLTSFRIEDLAFL